MILRTEPVCDVDDIVTIRSANCEDFVILQICEFCTWIADSFYDNISKDVSKVDTIIGRSDSTS